MLNVIICKDSKKRRKIHQYLDGKEHKVSLYCDLYKQKKQNFLY